MLWDKVFFLDLKVTVVAVQLNCTKNRCSSTALTSGARTMEQMKNLWSKIQLTTYHLRVIRKTRNTVKEN